MTCRDPLAATQAEITRSIGFGGLCQFSVRVLTSLSLLLIIFGQPLYAEPALEEDAEESNFTIELEERRERVARGVGDAVKRIDSLFGDTRDDEEVATSRLRLGGGVEVERGGTVTLSQRVRLSANFPRTENRVQLVVDSIATDEDDPEQEAFAVDDNISSALRTLLFESDRTRLSFDAGLKFRPRPDPFLRLRGRQLYEYGNWIIRPTQFLFWEKIDGFGETTRLDFDTVPSEGVLFRKTSEATWSEVSRGVEFTEAFRLFFAFADERALALEASAQAHTRPSTVVDRYTTLARLRQRFYKKWVFIEVTPGVRWRREQSYRASPFVAVLLEFLFDSEDV